MQSAIIGTVKTASKEAVFVAENIQLKEQAKEFAEQNKQLAKHNKQLQHQLDWFKRQLFGRKSEKRIEVSPDQLSLGFVAAPPEESPAESTQPVKAHTRRKRRHDCVTDSGLRFDDSVPVEVIELKAPELNGPDANDYEIIDHKITHRLAQRPGSYVVL